WDDSSGGSAAPAPQRAWIWRRKRRGRPRAHARSGAGDDGRLDLRARPNCGERRAKRGKEAAALSGRGIAMMEAGPLPSGRQVDLKIDGKDVRVPEGTTILDAAKTVGIETPTL